MIVVIVDREDKTNVRMVMQAPEGMNSSEIETAVELADEKAREEGDEDTNVGDILESQGFKYMDAITVETGE